MSLGSSMTTIETNEPMTFPAESPMMTTHDKDEYVVVLPCWGSPYIHGIIKEKCTNDDNLNLLQKAVMGNIALYDRKEFVIHPDFCSENRRWDLARQLLTSQYTKEIYVNDDVIHKCGVNTGTIITNPARRTGGCPHLMGDVALVVPKRVFEMLCPNPRTMMLYKNPKTSDEGENGIKNGCWEFWDEERDKATTYFEEKGYDFEEENGFCWLAKF